jgi:hypothetical protein
LNQRAKVEEVLSDPKTAARFVDLDAILSDGNVSTCQLSNILPNAAVILTNDGQLGYQVRGRLVQARPGAFTTAIAENVNRRRDDVAVDDWRRVLRSNEPADSKYARDASYQPEGVPHPLAALWRGIGDELTPAVQNLLNKQPPLLCTGLCFELDTLHPNLMFLIPVPLSAAAVLDLRRRFHGAEEYEGRLRFIPATFQHLLTQEVLNNERWVPGARAAVVRAIEVIDAIGRAHGGSFKETFTQLSSGT